VREAFGNEVGKLSGILIALFPAFIIYSGVLLTETLFLFLLSLLIWVLIRAVQSDSAWGWVLAGSVMGVTILLRKETLAMMVVFVALIRWKFPQRILIRKLSIFLLATALTVGVWTARNYLVYQKFIPVSVQGGDALWISTKGWTEWRDDEGLRSLIEGLDPLEMQKVLHREGIRNIVNDPLRYFIFCIKRLPHFWIASHTGHLMGFSGSFKQYYINGAFGKLFVKFTLLGAYAGLIFMGVWGAFITLKAEKERLGLKLFFLVPVLVKAITHFFLIAEARMQLPIMPFVLVFAATALYRLDPLKRLPLLRPCA
jgi:4-amino-4-deoxy-L-arabinose transferase-like glycosyltransferase